MSGKLLFCAIWCDNDIYVNSEEKMLLESFELYDGRPYLTEELPRNEGLLRNLVNTALSTYWTSRGKALLRQLLTKQMHLDGDDSPALFAWSTVDLARQSLVHHNYNIKKTNIVGGSDVVFVSTAKGEGDYVPDVLDHFVGITLISCDRSLPFTEKVMPCLAPRAIVLIWPNNNRQVAIMVSQSPNLTYLNEYSDDPFAVLLKGDYSEDHKNKLHTYFNEIKNWSTYDLSDLYTTAPK